MTAVVKKDLKVGRRDCVGKKENAESRGRQKRSCL